MRTKRKSRNTERNSPSLFKAFDLDKGSRQDARDRSIIEYLG